MRIAVSGIHIECSTYNPVLNEEKDFTVVRDAQLLASPRFRFLQDYPATFYRPFTPVLLPVVR